MWKGRAVSVYLPLEMVDEARRLGGDNISRGLRRLWETYKDHPRADPLTPFVRQEWVPRIQEYIEKHAKQSCISMLEVWQAIGKAAAKTSLDDGSYLFIIMRELGFETLYQGTSPRADFFWHKDEKTSGVMEASITPDDDFPY